MKQIIKHVIIILFLSVLGCYTSDTSGNRKSSYSIQPLIAWASKDPSIETMVVKPSVQKFARKHPSGVDCSFSLPTQREIVIAPLDRKSLIGSWQAEYNAFEIEYIDNGKFSRKWYVTKAEEDWVFKEAGTCSFEIRACGKLFKHGIGTWSYEDGLLTVIMNNETVPYRVDWINENTMAIRCRTNKQGSEMVTRHMVSKYPKVKYQTNINFRYDAFGCQRIVRKHVGSAGGIYAQAIETPHYCRRKEVPVHDNPSISNNDNVDGVMSIKDNRYELLSCERDVGDGFSYRFTVRIKNEKVKAMEILKEVQRDFRRLIYEDYLDSFGRSEAQSIHVAFPEYKFIGGKIEGRAVVLTIKVLEFVYDSSIQSGRFAVKINPEQYDMARQWIRENISSLAQSKQISVANGHLGFKTGKEVLRDDNVLEVEFYAGDAEH